jgi:hypothetical protein
MKFLIAALLLIGSTIELEAGRCRRRCNRSSVAAGFFAGAVTGAALASTGCYDDYTPVYGPIYPGAPVLAYDYPTYVYNPIYAYRTPPQYLYPGYLYAY